MSAAHPPLPDSALAPGPLRSGSLCTGYGGLDLAVMAVLGTRLAWCAEIDRHAAAVLAARYPRVPNLGDITALDWAAVPPVDLITADWPCQDISYSGPGAGIKEGTRSGLWLHIAAGLRQLRPSFVFLENVAALRTRGLGKVLADLAASMTRNGHAYALATPRPATAATACSSSAASHPPGLGLRLLPTPVAGAFNDTEPVTSWLARRDRQKRLGRNGFGTPLAIAIRLLPTPMASDSAAERAPQLGGQRPSGAKRQIGLPEVITHHLARLHDGNVRAQPEAGRERLLPTPDTGTSPRGHGRRGGRPSNGHQSGKDLDAAARTLTVPGGSGTRAAWGSTSRRSAGGNTSSASPRRPRPSPAPAAGPGCRPRSPSG